MNDMTLTIKVEAPDLVAALMRLASAVTHDPGILTSDAPNPHLTGSVPVSTNSVTASVQESVPIAASPTSAIPAVPVNTDPAYTLDQIAKAGATLVDAGKMGPLLALLKKYDVQAITQLPPAQYGVFATELRALGAQI